MMKSAAVALLVVTTLVSVTALVWIVIAQPIGPEIRRRIDEPVVAPVVERDYDGAQAVEAQLGYGRPIGITSPVAGRLTSIQCSPGSVIESGSSPISIEGRPLVALAGSTPWWRDVSPGIRGNDVKELHKSLRNLGKQVPEGDRVEASTIAAFNSVAKGRGAESNADVIPLASSVIWIPVSSTISQCEASLGDLLAPGAPLAKTSAAVSSVSIPKDSLRFPLSQSLLVVDGQEFPFDEGGQLSSPDLLKLSAVSRVVSAQASNEKKVSAVIKLKKAIRVAVLPPAAIVTNDGQVGCVVEHGRAIRLSILDSQLGQTSVKFFDDIPVSVNLRPPRDLKCPSS